MLDLNRNILTVTGATRPDLRSTSTATVMFPGITRGSGPTVSLLTVARSLADPQFL